MEDLGLNDHHKAVIVQFLRFARYQRGQRLRAIEACFEDVKDTRLLAETTFTRDEVEEILSDLELVVRGEAESELINASHTNVLLIKQMCQQAEGWHLKLSADVSDLENHDLLEHIRTFEETQMQLQPEKLTAKLEPIQGGAVGALLKAEISRLSSQNELLSKNLKSVEGQASALSSEKEQLSGALGEAKNKLNTLGSSTDKSSETVEKLKGEMDDLKAKLEKDLSLGQAEKEELHQKLMDAQQKFREADEKRLETQKDLEKKVHQTAQYRNLMKILKQRTSQLKEYRKRLAQYEPDFIAGGAEIEIGDD